LFKAFFSPIVADGSAGVEGVSTGVEGVSAGVEGVLVVVVLVSVVLVPVAYVVFELSPSLLPATMTPTIITMPTINNPKRQRAMIRDFVELNGDCGGCGGGCIYCPGGPGCCGGGGTFCPGGPGGCGGGGTFWPGGPGVSIVHPPIIYRFTPFLIVLYKSKNNGLLRAVLRLKTIQKERM